MTSSEEGATQPPADDLRVLGVFDATRPLRTQDACEALDHELLPKNVECTAPG